MGGTTFETGGTVTLPLTCPHCGAVVEAVDVAVAERTVRTILRECMGCTTPWSIRITPKVVATPDGDGLAHRVDWVAL